MAKYRRSVYIPSFSPRCDDEKVLERFMAKVRVQPDGCWIWTGATNVTGYGVFSLPGESTSSHRASYRLHKGDIPQGKFILHYCDVRNCVNPEHLHLGTQAENMLDMKLKGRAATGERHSSKTRPWAILKGEGHGCAQVTEEDVIAMRAMRERGMTYLSISEHFSVGKDMVGKICRRKNWKHI